MAIGENDAAALIDDEAGGVASGGGLGVEGASGGGAEDDDGGNDSVERLPPVLSSGDVFLKWRIDFHAQVIGLDGGAGVQTLRSQPLDQRISHNASLCEFNECVLWLVRVAT